MLNYGSHAVLERDSYIGIMPGEMSLLYEISGILNSKDEKKVLISEVLEKMNEHMGMIRGKVFILDRTGERVLFHDTVNMDYTGDFSGMDGIEDAVKQIVESGRPAAVSEPWVEKEILSEEEIRSEWSKHDMSFVCVPILDEGCIRGVLSADRFFGSGLSIDQTLMLMSTISSMISSAINFDEFSDIKPFLLEFNHGQECLPVGNIGNVLNNDRSFLLKGGDSTDRELFARELHGSSRRKDMPFLVYDCSKPGTDMVEIEVFGRQKSAFLGGLNEKPGLLEKAEGGTLFLDNVHRLSMIVQARLLKVLEEGTYYSIGSSEIKNPDVRLICATGRELKGESEIGSFNMGLYSLLDRYSVDIRGASGILKRNLETEPVENPSEKAYEMKYEKEKVTEIIDPEEIDCTLQESLDALEYDLIVKRLKQNTGNVSKTAEELGLTQRILGLRLKKYNIDFKDYRKTGSGKSA